MQRSEVMSLIHKIKSHRKFFGTDPTGVNITKEIEEEWYRLLKDYDYVDIDSSLEKWLMNENNISQEPSPYILRKYALTIEEKKIRKGTVIYCEVCRKALNIVIREKEVVNRIEADEHMSRCRSIRYLKQLYIRHFDREIDEVTENDFKKMSKSKFDETYYLILHKAYDRMPESEEKELLSNVLKTI